MRIPLPIRSPNLTASTPDHEVTRSKPGLAAVEMAYPATASHLRWPIKSESQPENTLSTLAVLSAEPSIRPMAAVGAPSRFLRKSGTSQESISLEMSVRKLVSVTAQTFSGKARGPRGLSPGGGRDEPPASRPLNLGTITRHPRG